MDIAVINPQAILQMYHCKDYPWHSLATSPLAVAAAADNKEKIIANADFTTTSAIARRRLSSKKRRNLEGLAGDGGGTTERSCNSSSSISSEGSASSSPTGSLEFLNRHPPPQSTSSPTTTCSTPPPLLNSVSLPQRSLPNVSATTHLSTHLPPHTHTHQVVPSHPQATIASHGSSVPLVPAAYHFAPSLPVATAPDHKALPHPVYSQLQQELNYRYLQDQSGAGPGSIRSGNRGTAAFSAPHSQPNNPHQQGLVGVASSAMDQSESGRPHRIRWCSAHVTIAKQILAHQQQSKNVLDMARSSAAALTANSAAVASSKPVTTSTAAAAASLDPAHQITLLQMYGIPTNAVTGGYMATLPGMPYPALPPFIQNTAPAALYMDPANVLSLKTMPGVATCTSDSSNQNMHMVNGVQLFPYPPAGAAAAHHQTVPMAAVMPGVGVSSAVSGSYIGHVPVPVIGNCVLNPCPPGVMAAPWVR